MVAPQPSTRTASPQSFTSQCLSEFLARLVRLDPHPAVLDLGVLCGGNIAFLGSRGCRVSVESLPSVTRPATPAADTKGKQAGGKPAGRAAGKAEAASPAPAPEAPALAATVAEAASPLSYPKGSFSGVLAWDAISRMPAQEAIGFVETLRKLLDGGGVVLAYFPGPPGNTGGAAGRYRIQSEDKVEVESALERHVNAPAYQNREIYALFSRFEVIRLSHLKSGTREVLVAKSKRSAKD